MQTPVQIRTNVAGVHPFFFNNKFGEVPRIGTQDVLNSRPYSFDGLSFAKGTAPLAPEPKTGGEVALKALVPDFPAAVVAKGPLGKRTFAIPEK